jgi:hypothetical protein
MQDNVQDFIDRIRNSDLSETDKKILIEKLDRVEPDILGFSDALLVILKVTKEVLKFLDIDIGDFF